MLQLASFGSGTEIDVSLATEMATDVFYVIIHIGSKNS